MSRKKKSIQHKNKYAPGAQAVLCGHACIGQIQKCNKEWHRENNKVQKRADDHLTVRCSDSGCLPYFHYTKIVYHDIELPTRLIPKAAEMKLNDLESVSMPIISLNKKNC